MWNKTTRQFTYRMRLYLSESLKEKDLPRMKRKLESCKRGLVAILIAENPNDQLDLVSSDALKSKVYEGKAPVLIGIAKDKEDAALLVEKITQDCLKSRGDLNLRAYCEEGFDAED